MSLKLAITGFLVFMLGFGLRAQDCTPDQSITATGFFPKTIEDAAAGQAYKQVLQIRVFKDTVVIISGNPTLATIDSINVKDILSLPNGFYYTCSRKNCSFIPDSTGCAALIGNPTNAEVGTYPLLIAIEVYAKIFGTISSTQADTLDQFNMTVTGMGAVESLFDSYSKVFYPNPSNGSFNYNSLLSNYISSLTCRNTLGQIVPHSSTTSGFDILTSVAGIFYVEVELENGTRLVEKIVVDKN